MKDTVKYNKLFLYYFSGTGNARNAASWIKDVAELHGIETHVFNIERIEWKDIPEITKECLLGICSPTHGFNLPPIVLKFIRKFPGAQNVDAFIVNTRAGMKLRKQYLPGISGSAQLLSALMLRLKGFRIVGMQPLDLPSNWLILHPGLRTKVVSDIYQRCKGITRQFFTKILSGRTSYRALRSLPVDIAFLPLTFGYFIVGRFIFAKTLVSTNSCNNCMKCIRQCPVKAISMVHDKPFWSYKCESCMRCVNACPQRAIETAHAFTIGLLLVSSMIISPSMVALLKVFNIWPLFTHSASLESLWSLIYAFIFLAFVMISYRIMHYLMRYKWIHQLVKYTSLSTYRFWRRYKAPKKI